MTDRLQWIVNAVQHDDSGTCKFDRSQLSL